MAKEQRIEEIANLIFRWKDDRFEGARQINALFPQGDDEGLLKKGYIIELWRTWVMTDCGTQKEAEELAYTRLKELAKAQRDLTRQERLDRPDREKIEDILGKSRYGSEAYARYKSGFSFPDDWQNFQLDVNQIDALIPDEEEIRKQLDTLKTEIADLNKKLDDREIDLKEAVKDGEIIGLIKAIENLETPLRIYYNPMHQRHIVREVKTFVAWAKKRVESLKKGE